MFDTYVSSVLNYGCEIQGLFLATILVTDDVILNTFTVTSTKCGLCYLIAPGEMFIICKQAWVTYGLINKLIIIFFSHK